MSGFKLLAIRPLVGCDSKFLKNLKAGQLYKFYNNVSFKNGNENFDIQTDSDPNINVTEIHVQPNPLENLYSVISNKKNITINISAIVGSNGSGKSALTELLLYALFTISFKLKYVKRENFIFDQIEDYNFKKDLEEIKKGLKVEFYCFVDESLKVVRIENNKVFFYNTLKKNKNHVIQRNKPLELTRREQLSDFFYTMVVNFSLYAFNSDEIGIWIKSIFHKNDGYQMPVVVNPFRNRGIIDVSQEAFLTRSRFLSNIISIRDYKKIESTLEVDNVIFKRNALKIDRLFNIVGKSKERYSDEFTIQFRKKIILPLYKKMYGYKKTDDLLDDYYPNKLSTSSNIYNIVELYLINKIISITSKYTNFEKYNLKINLEQDITDNFNLGSSLIEEFVTKLYQDRSHITIKIRQSLNFLKYNIFNIKEDESFFEVNFDVILKKLNELTIKNHFTEIVDYLPPPVFFSEIRFKNGSLFKDLSSGQRQSIYSLNSIIYHLKNIDSVNKSSLSKKMNKYNSVNLILDEIELYFHPEYQRRYINDLLFLIENCNLEFINNINITFLTHSPFILSDIPNNNVLKLDNGVIIPYGNNNQTFGANINDILANEFFLKSGFMGEFVKEKINSLVDYLDEGVNTKRKWNEKSAKNFIEIIGEPLIRLELRELYFSKFYNIDQIDIDQIDQEIERLKRIKSSKTKKS